jgi:hypothetical protein
MIKCPLCYGYHEIGTQCQRVDKEAKLNSYIDNCLINEYANKDFNNAYYLSVDELSDHEVRNFIDELMKYSPAAKEMIMDYMQLLIDARLPHCEAEDRRMHGFHSYRDYETGEVIWERNRGF